MGDLDISHSPMMNTIHPATMSNRVWELSGSLGCKMGSMFTLTSLSVSLVVHSPECDNHDILVSCHSPRNDQKILVPNGYWDRDSPYRET